jgi:hypothetical protein
LYREPEGRESVERWIQELDREQRGELVDYLNEFLRPNGPHIVERADDDDPELARRHGEIIEAMVEGSRESDSPTRGARGRTTEGRISLRIFFSTDGKGTLVVLDGYDRGSLGDQTARVLERAHVRYRRWRSNPRSHME